MPNFPTIIQNGNSIPINQQCGTIPDVSGAIFDTFQPMVFETIVKTVQNFQVVETPTLYNILGNWIPFSPRQLLLKPEGQRAWSWYTCFAQWGLELTTDQVIKYEDKQYRVMGKKNFKLHGYVEYELIEDWTGSGP